VRFVIPRAEADDIVGLLSRRDARAGQDARAAID
jgi:hypothetical protein